MGFFDFLKKKNSSPPSADTKTAGRSAGDRSVARLGRVVADKLAQNYDRMEAIEALSKVHTSEAAAALLKRFSFAIEPSITDQEEKEVAFRGVVACGEEAIVPVLQFCEKAESLTWPLKILKEILPPERYVEEVVDLLDAHDTDWSRNVDPKLHLIRALEGQKNDEVKEVLVRFLEDVSEPVRFQTTIALFSLEDPSLLPKILEKIGEEESTRLVVKVAESLKSRGWEVPEAFRQPLARALRSSPSGYDVDEDGRVVR
ncbi:MAG: hypothetical protein RMJ98_13160 [Myxococcales bacterium]|nr:HEAT repeat domain-containing protein [Polyangiaceae bacterium]MDW8250237.1 hypothetical protein [Myxococcales bacterium]